MHNIEGDLQKLDDHTFRILMIDAYEEDVISDIRERILKTLKDLIITQKQAIPLNENILLQIQGSMNFFLRETSTNV